MLNRDDRTVIVLIIVAINLIVVAMALLIGFFAITMDPAGLYQAQCGDLAFTFELRSAFHDPTNPETGQPIFLGDDCTFELIKRY